MLKHPLFKMAILLFLAICNIAFAGDGPPPPQVAISPLMIETTLGKKPSNEIIYVYNLGNEPMTVHTTIAHWDTDEKNEVRVIPPTEQSLDQWIIINPLKFTVPAGERQTIRLSIRPHSLPSAGEHRGIIFFENEKPDSVKTTGTYALFKIGVGVYGLAGDIERHAILESLTLNKKKTQASLAFTIKSTGNANIRLAGQFTLWRKEDFSINSAPMLNLNDNEDSLPEEVLHAEPLTTLPILPGTTRTLQTSVPLPEQAGEYIVFVNGSLGDTIIKKVFDLHIP